MSSIFCADPAARQRWTFKLQQCMQQSNKPWIPNGFSRVCFDQFIDKVPTDDYPDSEFKLRYNAKVVKRRNKPAVRVSASNKKSV